MIEGIDGDDRYRMVEDEFLATARQFTAHLHAAEYKRFKAASELENAQVIQSISRPVVGKMTDLVRIKQERKARGEKQRLAARKLRKGNADDDDSTGSDGGGDGSWQKQSLYGLMESPGRRARRLHGLPPATSVTRAAAGYDRQTSDPVSPSRTKTRALPDMTRRHMHGGEDHTEVTRSSSVAYRIPQRVSTTSSRVAKPEPRQVDKPVLGESYKVTANLQNDGQKAAEEPAGSDGGEGMDFLARLKKRQEERKRSRGQRKSTSSKVKSDLGDILPDFL